MTNNIIITLDLSTNSTGYAVFNVLTKKLITYGMLEPKIPGLHKMKYPEGALHKILDLSKKIKELIEKYQPETVVVEEVNRGINRIAQKSLDALHFFVLNELLLMSFDIKKKLVYFDSNGKKGWRGTLGLRLSPKDKEQNKLARAIKRKNSGDLIPEGTKAPRSRTVDWKELACRFVEKQYGLKFDPEKENDIADAICLGHTYITLNSKS